MPLSRSAPAPHDRRVPQPRIGWPIGVAFFLGLLGCDEDPTPPPGDLHGACCLPDRCELRTAAACFADGIYLGDGTSCDPPSCQPEGACCLPGICTVGTVSACPTPGLYQGDGTTCVPDPCPPVSACCLGDACELRTEADCQSAGGDSWGEGSTCTPSMEAGPNRGGVLLVHHLVGVDPDQVGRSCQLGIERCDEVVPTAPADSVVVVAVFAAFPASTTPQVGSVVFGIRHGLEILRWEACGTAITWEGWPASGSGIAVSWQPGASERFFPVCWFVVRAAGGALDLGDHPRFGPPRFREDTLPARENPVRALGRVGFGETPGRRLCPCP